jgi:hypothetical protein
MSRYRSFPWMSFVAAVLVVVMLASARAAVAGNEDSVPATGDGGWVGLSLEEALHRLRSANLRIVFSDEVVRPTMSIETRPQSSEARALLEEILLPHGLEIREGPGDTLIVIRKEPSLSGEVVDAVSGLVRATGGEPIARARVRAPDCGAETATDSQGRFEIDCRDDPVTELEVMAGGYSDRQLEAAELLAKTGQLLVITLDAIAVFEEQLLVTPSSISLLQDVPVAPLALGREEIEGLPQLGGDFFRALTLLPGTSSNDVSARFHVRGGLRSETQILLDGQELYDGFHLKDRDGAVSFIVPETIGEAELDTGGFSVRYGDRMSGVLDMTSVAPPSERRFRVGLGVLGANVGGGGPLNGERGGWMFEARRGVTDLVGRLLGDEDPAFWDVLVKLDRRVGTRQILQGHVLATGDELDFSEELEDENKIFETSYGSTYAWLTHQAMGGADLIVQSALSLAETTQTRRGVESEDSGEFEIFDQRESEILGVRQDWKYSLEEGRSLQLGWHLRSFETEYDYFSSYYFDTPLATIRHDSGDGGGAFTGEFEDQQLGSYASIRSVLSPSTTIEVGVRWDRHSLTDESLGSPRLNLARRVGDRSVLRLAWGRYSQSQRTYELNVEDGERDFEPVERSEHRVVGLETMIGRQGGTRRGAIRIELYRRDVDNPRPRFENLFEPVNTFPEVEPDRVLLAPQRSRAEGLEVFARSGFGRRTGWWASYSWAVTEDLIDGSWVPRLFDQRHSLKLDVDVRPTERWNVNAAWRFHTGWPTTPLGVCSRPDGEDGPEIVPVLGPLNSERLPDYHRLDARVSRFWIRSWGSLTFFIDVQNLYDRRNAAGFDIEIDEEDGLLTSVAESWPGILPSAGIRFEF